MSIADELVNEHPWRTLVGAFFVGAGLAMDRRVRGSLVLSGLQIVRAIAVEHAKQLVRAAIADDGYVTYARA